MMTGHSPSRLCWALFAAVDPNKSFISLWLRRFFSVVFKTEFTYESDPKPEMDMNQHHVAYLVWVIHLMNARDGEKLSPASICIRHDKCMRQIIRSKSSLHTSWGIVLRRLLHRFPEFPLLMDYKCKSERQIIYCYHQQGERGERDFNVNGDES